MCEAQIRTFGLDPESSDISFGVSHLGFLTVDGKFSKFSGKCEIQSDTLLSISGVISVASIDTDDKTRDESLKSEAYLDSENYPQIEFYSTSIKSNDGFIALTGKLKIKDQERIIHIPIEYVLADDRQSCLIMASTSINRKDFLLDFGAMDALVGDEVSIELKMKALSKP